MVQDKNHAPQVLQRDPAAGGRAWKPSLPKAKPENIAPTQSMWENKQGLEKVKQAPIGKQPQPQEHQVAPQGQQPQQVQPARVWHSQQQQPAPIGSMPQQWQ
eukprot:6371042-Amphidinium_carterae.1